MRVRGKYQPFTLISPNVIVYMHQNEILTISSDGINDHPGLLIISSAPGQFKEGGPPVG